MTWFRIDDGFARHKKWEGLRGPALALAAGVWSLSGSDSASRGTAGHVSRYTLESLFGKSKAISSAVAELVARRFWDPSGDGWDFHDWTDYQPNAEEIAAKKRAAAERQRLKRARMSGLAVTRDVPRDVPGDVPRDVERESRCDSPRAPARRRDPDPTRPDPTPDQSECLEGKQKQAPTETPPPEPPSAAHTLARELEPEAERLPSDAQRLVGNLGSPVYQELITALRRHAASLAGLDIETLAESIDAINTARPKPIEWLLFAIETAMAKKINANKMMPPMQKHALIVGFCQNASPPERAQPAPAPTNGRRFGPDPSIEAEQKRIADERAARDLREQMANRDKGPRIAIPERERQKPPRTRPQDVPATTTVAPRDAKARSEAITGLLAGVGRPVPAAKAGEP